VVCRAYSFVVLKLSSYLLKQYLDINYKTRNVIIAKYTGLELSRLLNADFYYRLTNLVPAINGLTIYKGLTY